jgi:hypothetical protein
VSRVPIDSGFLDLKAGFDDDRDQAVDALESAGVPSGEEQYASGGDDDPTGPIPGGGALLEEESAAKVFKAIDRMVQRQDRLAKNREQTGIHYDRIKNGCQFSILEKSEDRSVYEAVLPPGVQDVEQPIPNKVLDLCGKQVSQILVDPPLPNPKPEGDPDRSRGAIDLARKFLRDDGDVSGTNDQELWRAVLTRNRTWASAFVFVWVDPTGGGWRPKQKKAHPRAEDPAKPLQAPMLDANGQPITRADGSIAMERSSEPVLRYVGEQMAQDGEPIPGAVSLAPTVTGEPMEMFVEHASEAAREWLPKHRRMILPPNQVRTIPKTADAATARAIILLMWEPLGEARRRFPVLESLSKEQLKRLAQWKPKRWKSLVPEAQLPKGDDLDDDGGVSDDTLIFWYHKFCRIGPDYHDGAEIAVNGAAINATGGAGSSEKGGFLLTRDTLREDVETDEGATVPVLMDPPVAQFRGYNDTDGGDPFGVAPVKMFGGANEIRAHLYLGALEDIDVRLHPNTYLMSTSTITREDMNRRDGTPLELISPDDKPTFEQRPPLPAFLPDMLERIEHEMDTLANLNQTAQALDSGYSQSGEAKKVAIRQAKTQLAQDWQNFVGGVVQYWRIKVQLAQARLTTPQLVRMGTENAAYKQRYFVGSDMVGVDAIALAPGSGTMMSPAEKAQYLATMQQQKWLAPDVAGELARASMADDLGLPPNPHQEHIDRSVADWVEGAPPGWLEEVAQREKATAQYQQQMTATMQQMVAAFTSQGADPQSAQQAAQQQATQQLGPAPQFPPMYTPFEPRPNDEEPTVAQIHYYQLSKLMATTDYSKQPIPWRKVVDERYKLSAYAAGVQTVREQHAAQAQAAGQQQGDKGPPVYQEFLAAVNAKVVAAAEQALAMEVERLAGLGKQEAPQEAPAEQPPDTTHLELAHASNEAAKTRAHERDMAQMSHGQAMEQTNSKNATSLAATLHKADRSATRQSGAPGPERGGATRPPQGSSGGPTLPTA